MRSRLRFPPRSDLRYAVPGLAGFSSTLLCVYSLRREVPDFSGALIDVERVNDNAIISVGFNPQTNELDIAAIAAHCGANNGRVSEWKNQKSGSSDVIGNATASARPLIWDGATQSIYRNASGQPEVRFSGTQRLFRSDAFGKTGNPALSTGFAGTMTTAAVPAWSTGGTTTGTIWNSGRFSVASDDLYIDIASSYRQFGQVKSPNSPQFHVARKAASVTVSAFRCRQMGQDLSETDLVNGSNSLNMGNGRFTLGCFNGSSSTTVSCSCVIHVDADISGDDLAILESALGRHV